ncbi:MAG: hypothetical protein NUV74_05150 [Candidatus Brocadiaceae bacterium]|nr:hypothetical protein [Candidatus Brocadiaceae bacterium]
MANPWFRLYAEFSHDPKVQLLSEQDQRRLIMIFCIRCNGSVTLQDKYVTFQLRISDQEWQQTKDVFIDAGFIDQDNNVLNWDKRQYVSDSSVERVRRHRALHKPVTVTPCNVTVTPPEQNRTDTEQNIKTKAAAFALPDWIDKTQWDLWIKTRKGKKMIPEQMQAQVAKLQKWRDAGMDHARALADAASAGWQGLFEPKPPTGKRQPENFAAKDYGTGVNPL